MPGGLVGPFTLIVLVASLTTFPAHAQNLVTNGSFEEGTHVSDGCNYMRVGAGSVALTDWTVVSEVAWGKNPCDGFTASDGVAFVDLSSFGSQSPNGELQQSLDTTPGTEYVFSIDRQGSNAAVSLGGSPLDLTPSSSSGPWTTYTAAFTATSSTTILSIRNVTPLVQVVFVDNVVLEAPGSDGDLILNVPINKIGEGLQQQVVLSRVGVDAVIVHLESSDPSKALLAPVGHNAPLTSSIDVRINRNVDQFTPFFIHGISQGPVDIVATAPGLNSVTESFTIVPAVLVISGLGGQQPAQGPEDQFLILVGINNPEFNPQFVSRQHSLFVLVSVDDVNIGKIRDSDAKKGSPTSSVSKEIPPGVELIFISFVPQNLGEVIVFAEIPSNVVDVTVAVVPGPAFQLLIDEIDDANLTRNQKKYLISLVLRSIDSFRDNDIDGSTRRMGIFIKRINTLEKTNKISSSVANRLIDIANTIGFALANPPD